jgi:two-component system, NtrC family, sensor histidine kinase HydH
MRGQTVAEATDHDRTGRKRVRLRLRLISAVTLIVLGGAVVASSLVVQNAIRDQERVLLQERAGEAASVLAGAFAGVQDSLELLGTLALTNQGRPAAFASAARLVITTSNEGVLVTARRGTKMVVTAAAGNAPAVGQAIPADQEQLARRSLSTAGMVSAVLPAGSRRWLAFAIGNAAGPGTVVWERAAFSAAASAQLPTGPWGDLNLALYLSSRPEPAALLAATTSKLPLAGGVQYPFTVGAGTWLLVASSPQPIVGRLAHDAPWLVLGIGAIVAVLVTMVVEIQGRRRDYAAALVQERTTSLRQAVTDLEQAQVQLVRQEKMAAMGQLASTVGHELRNPLAVIMNVLYLMEIMAGAGASEAMRRHLATAKRETSAANLIVSDLLDYAADRAPLSAPVQLADLVTEALSVVPPPTGVEVVTHVEPDTEINADRDQIRQVLLNLITNGYDAMPDGGVLDVSVRPAQDSAQITVTDTGMGMDMETRSHIFTPFYTTKSRGIGLGLAVIKRVVEAHGGAITVQSTPSVGTSFTVTVPAARTVASVPR